MIRNNYINCQQIIWIIDCTWVKIALHVMRHCGLPRTTYECVFLFLVTDFYADFSVEKFYRLDKLQLVLKDEWGPL